LGRALGGTFFFEQCFLSKSPCFSSTRKKVLGFFFFLALLRSFSPPKLKWVFGRCFSPAPPFKRGVPSFLLKGPPFFFLQGVAQAWVLPPPPSLAEHLGGEVGSLLFFVPTTPPGRGRPPAKLHPLFFFDPTLFSPGRTFWKNPLRS